MAFDQARGARRGRPDIDDRLVVPETRYEMRDGELVYVSPADPPHGTRHAQLIALIEAHTGVAFEVACDLLTRTSEVDDIAPDVSVYPEPADPETGGRQLDELAFEVVSTQSLAPAGEKAADLVGRGVRRVFAIDVRRSRALEWSAVHGGWEVLDAAGDIVDPALAVPLPVAALLHSARADDAVARALLSKGNPVLVEARERDRAEGQAEGRRRGKAEGLAEGRRRGKAEGLANGRRRGKAEGLAEGRRRGKAEGLADGRRRGKAEGLAEGRRRGKAEGLAEGRRRGKAEGRADGRRRGKAEALIAVLTARGVGLDRAARKRILGEGDPARVDRWIARAVTCSSVTELLAEP